MARPVTTSSPPAPAPQHPWPKIGDDAEISARWRLIAILLAAFLAIARFVEDFDSTLGAVASRSAFTVLIVTSVGLVFGAGVVNLVRQSRTSPTTPGSNWWVPLLASPLLFLGVVGTDLLASDTAILLSSIRHTWSGDANWLLRSQDAPVPHLVYGLPLELGVSGDELVVIPLGFSIGLLLFVAWAVYRRTADPVAAATALLCVLGLRVFYQQAFKLPMYPLFTLAGCIGIFSLARMVDRSFTWRRWSGAGIGIVLAVASHGAGLYFVLAAGCVIVLVKDKEAFGRLVLGGLSVAFFGLPWLVSRVWIGGLRRVATPRDSWVLNEGYLLDVNREYWQYPVGSRVETGVEAVVALGSTLGIAAWLVVPLCLVGLHSLSGRWRLFAVLLPLALILPLAATQSNPFLRYYYPLLPGIGALAGMGVATLRAQIKLRPMAELVVAGMLLLVLSEVGSSLVDVARRDARWERERGEAAAFAPLVAEGSAFMGLRSFRVTAAYPMASVFYQDLLQEEDFVGLYQWDESRLRELMQEQNVRYVVLRTPAVRFEQAYTDTWIEPAYGAKSRYVAELSDPSADCLVAKTADLEVYDLRACLR